MRTVWRVATFSVCLVLAAVAVGAGVLAWLYLDTPPLSGEISAEELSAEVNILFDGDAIPHVFADSWQDAHFALGYLHARDRLWQMEMQRRVGQGRVSEVLGKGALDLDRFMRTLGLYQAAESDVDTLSGPTRDALQAYSDGVNHYLTSRSEPLPLEFQLTFHEPEPWRPADSAVWVKTMALILSGNYQSELRRARLLSRVSPDRLAELFPDYDASDPITLGGGHRRQGWDSIRLKSISDASSSDVHQPPGVGSTPARRAGQTGSARDSERSVQSAAPATLCRPAVPPDQRCQRAVRRPPFVSAELQRLWPLGDLVPGETSASNEWVVAGEHTETGSPILANDPHLALNAPTLWYLARIQVRDRWIIGGTVPGFPFHVLGQNDSVAWGMTNTGGDVQDLVIETLDPDNPDRYWAGDDWKAVSVRQETIRVRFGGEVVHPARSTHTGPLLSDVSPQAAELVGPNRATALVFTALQPGDRTLDAMRALGLSHSWSEARDALRHIASPQLNVAFADTAGVIALLSPARVPVRARHDGRFPINGGDVSPVWSGYVPYEQLPFVSNPLDGWIANANNALVDDGYPFFIGAEWEPPYRARRIDGRLRRDVPGNDGYSVADAMALQKDTISGAALELLPLLTAIPGDSPAAERALEALRRWDGNMLRDRPEPALFYLWLRALNRTLFLDDLGEHYTDYAGLHPRVVRNVLTGLGHWCDDITTTERVESCAHALHSSLARALDDGRNLFSGDFEAWRWGTLHRARFPHPLFDLVPGLGSLFDISIETDGGNYTVNRGASYPGPVEPTNSDSPFAHRHGPGYRAVYDLEDPAQSRFIISTGQSGNPLSAHYGDMVERWRDGEYLTLLVDLADLLELSSGRLRLIP